MILSKLQNESNYQIDNIFSKLILKLHGQIWIAAILLSYQF